MAEQTAGRAIGEIFAQMIDYRKANKDKVENYIIQTSMYALDPRVRAERARYIAELERSRKNLDDRAQAIEEGNIENVGNIRETWVSTTGDVAKVEAGAIADVAQSDIAGRYGLAKAKVDAASALNVVREKGKQDRQTKVLEANLDIVEGLEKEVSAATSREGSRLDGALKTASDYGLGQGSPLDQATLQTIAKEVWEKQYKADYLAAANSPMTQKTIQQGFQNALTEIIATSDANTPAGSTGLGSVLGTTGFADLVVGSSAGDISREDFGKSFTTVREEQINLRTQDPDVRAAALKSTANIGPGRTFESYIGAIKAGEVAGAPIFRQLGLDSPEQLPEFYNRTAYNRYLLASKQADPNAVVPSYTEFKTKIGQGGVEDRFIDYTKSAPVEETLNFANKSYIDILLERQGLEGRIGEERAIEAKAKDTLLSPGQLARETQTEYYRQYGGPGQRRLVAVEDRAARMPIEYTNPETGKTETVYLDTPEMELLLGKGKVPPPPIPAPVPAPVPVDAGPPRPIEEEPEPPLDLTGGPERGEGARLKNRVITYEEDQIPLGPGKAIGEKAKPDVVPLTEEELNLLPEGDEDLPEAGDEATQARNLIEEAARVQAQLQLAETPEEQKSFQDKLAEISKRARRLVVDSQDNPLTDEDFDNAGSVEELISKATPVKPLPQSATTLKAQGSMLIEAEASSAASSALAENRRTGKAPAPEKFVKKAKSIPPNAIAFLKDLATKQGRINASELHKAVVSVLGKDASQDEVNAAKSIYLAYEEIG